MNIGYIRVSTNNQNLETQTEALTKFGIDRLFQEKESGLITDRSAFIDAIDHLRFGDTLVIYDLSRLGRTFYQLMKLIDELVKKEIGLVSIVENLDITTPMGRAMIRIMASFNQMQVELQNEKIKEGLANAKANGKKLGRKSISNEIVRMIKALCRDGFSNQEVADKLNISRRTVINYKNTKT